MNLPISLTRRGWGFGLTALVVGASWFVIGLRDLWYFSALFAAMMLVAVLWLLFATIGARLAVQVATSSRTPSVGDTVVLTSKVHHRLPFGIKLPVRVQWQLEDETILDHTVLVPASGVVSRVGLRIERRGTLYPGVPFVAVADPLGLAIRRVLIKASLELLALPRLDSELAHALQVVAQDARGGQTPSRNKTQVAELPSGAIREYRSGDALRHVHWKQSARQGQLLVKLSESSEHPATSLTLVTDRDAYVTIGDFETAVTSAATLATILLRRGQMVQLRLGADSPVIHYSEISALEALASVKVHEQNEGRPSYEGGLSGFILTGTVTDALFQVLSRSPGGTLITVSTGASILPPGWRQVTLPPLIPLEAHGPRFEVFDRD